MPLLRIPQTTLAEWGAKWSGSEGSVDGNGAPTKKPRNRSTFETNKQSPTSQKLRGGYYTPRALAEYLCRWAVRSQSDRVIEPSCGDGSFVSAAARLLDGNGLITAVEIVPGEIEKARESADGAQVRMDWRCGSFFDMAPSLLEGRPYDVVVGNPPFIRFQHFDKDERERAFRLLRSSGYKPTGLANAWIAFVQLSAELLREGGRLAMVVPAELLQVRYAAELRCRLPMLFEDVYIVAFDELIFPQIQQEVVLLLGEGRRRYSGICGRLHTRQVANGEALLAEATMSEAVSHLPERHTHGDMKWTSLFLEAEEFQVLKECDDNSSLDRLGRLAEVDVGIVTGRNSFFVVSEDHMRNLGVRDHTLDVIGRTSALRSVRFTRQDMLSYAKSNRSKLLNLSGLDRRLFPRALEEYIRLGEAQGVSWGYKCRIRNRWFDVPSVSAPDAFLFRQIHKAPLLVANDVGATATDTIHRVRVHRNVDCAALCGSMVNSLTFALSEVCGRSYGGGVLELEPREAENLLLPYRFAVALDLEYVDGRLRAGDLEAALDHGDDVLLRQGCGLSKADVARARGAWNRLRRRRQGRRQGARTRQRNAPDA